MTPAVRIVRGRPDADELAALVAVLLHRNRHRPPAAPPGAEPSQASWIRNGDGYVSPTSWRAR